MHVIYFHQHFSTPRGMAGIRSYEMARRLLHHGHTVTMVCGSYGMADTGLVGEFRNGRRDGIVDGIRVIEFDLSYANAHGFLKRLGVFAKFAARGMWLALREDYDLLFATSTPLTASLPGIIAQVFRRKPFVFEVRDLWPELPKAMGVIRNPVLLGLMSALEWMSYHTAQRTVALSPGMADGIARRGIPRSRIGTIPNGCDLGIFAAGKSEPWRPDSVGPTDLMAIFTGAHGKANGLEAVLDAAAILKQRKADSIKLVLVGDGMVKPALQRRALVENLDNVIFLAPMKKEAIAGLMMSANVGLQLLANIPAFYEGTSPNKFFDYIASGLPVLNNYPGWLARMITESNCGLAVPPENPAAFADALQWANDHRDELRTMGRNSLALAKSSFDRHVLADQWVAFVTGASPS